MAISASEIMHIAKLARLEIDEAQFERLSRDMDSIVEMVGQLQNLNLDDVDLSLSGRVMQPRADEVKPSFPREKILQNAPQKEAGCFVVPKVVEED
ncbi:Asp-tRNA(Asn)/Glu-tRNA(Gln) amidotransferase subunit GatC [Feifania hominis]|uniref:Aspartyl/glutamyl-tRNA(Asn/Gln) amidotransferase subunit C n=1 Tax=Feifania hominis TaxID=2763660 RepID=A0A926DC71_9FIRM|nr:Asp-tRNA(Asn)/Glu-tRNA(Gln) amidotransferase subunit GatC [Feifania hominis]MBC8535531.1 Asp-tRNA(Asn)/Glu-tRNA(Gln) amidotransferase subunit GatC [Feifania hominis]